MASHDLATPVRVVSGYAAMLLEDFEERLGPNGVSYVADSSRSAERMQTLISDLLAYAQVGGMVAGDEPVDLGDVVADVAADVMAVASGGPSPVGAEDLPVVRGNPSHVRLVVQNLIANALKFTEDEEDTPVHVSAEVSGRWATVTVTDHGIGFDPADAQRIFEPLRRLVGPDQYSGTGLGLAICRRVVESHGGRIWAESTPGVGSSFHFTLTVASR